MKKGVYDYFVNLDEQKLTRHKNIIIADSHIAKESEYDRVELYHVNGTPMYAKPWNGSFAINAVASAQMYNELGILTPPLYLMQKKKKKDSDKFHSLFDGYSKLAKQCKDMISMSTLQQDVYSLKYFYCELAEDVVKQQGIKFDRFHKFKWQVLYDSDLRRKFLEYI